MLGNRTVVAFAAVAIGYAILACVGLQWAQVNGAGSPIWPAAGFGLAALLLGGPELWPAIVIGRLVAGYLSGSQQPLMVELAISFGNAGGAYCAAIFLERKSFDRRLHRLNDALLYLAFGALVEPLVSGIVGTAALAIANDLPGTEALTLFVRWVVGGFVGALIVGPLVLSWATLDDAVKREPVGMMLSALPVAAVAVVSWLVFVGSAYAHLHAWQVTPFLIWAALGSGMRGATAALAIMAFMAVWGGNQNPVAFGAGLLTPAEQLALMQQFIAVTAIPVILLAAVAEERRRRGDELLRLALDAAQQGIWDLDAASQRLALDQQSRALFGVDATEDDISIERMISRVHPDDQPMVASALSKALDTSGDGTYCVEHRVDIEGQAPRWLAVFGKTTFLGTGLGRTPVLARGVVRDVTARRNAEERQQLLIRELVHRGKNQLTIIQSITSRTLDSSSSVDDVRTTLMNRLHALARTFSLFDDSAVDGAALHDIIELEFETFFDRADAEGPHIVVSSDTAQNIALVVHELATNAIKYGALANNGGHIEVRWKVTAGKPETFELSWVERGGVMPAAGSHQTGGFGSILIGRLVPSQLGGTAHSGFGADGFEYVLRCPLARIGRVAAGPPIRKTAAALG